MQREQISTVPAILVKDFPDAQRCGHGLQQKCQPHEFVFNLRFRPSGCSCWIPVLASSLVNKLISNANRRRSSLVIARWISSWTARASALVSVMGTSKILTRRVADQPPAMAPMMRSGSFPDATASGSGVSGGSCDRSSSQAKKRKNGRRCCVT